MNTLSFPRGHISLALLIEHIKLICTLLGVVYQGMDANRTQVLVDTIDPHGYRALLLFCGRNIRQQIKDVQHDIAVVAICNALRNVGMYDPKKKAVAKPAPVTSAPEPDGLTEAQRRILREYIQDDLLEYLTGQRVIPRNTNRRPHWVQTTSLNLMQQHGYLQPGTQYIPGTEIITQRGWTITPKALQWISDHCKPKATPLAAVPPAPKKSLHGAPIRVAAGTQLGGQSTAVLPPNYKLGGQSAPLTAGTVAGQLMELAQQKRAVEGLED
jgi:hypothetical protein